MANALHTKRQNSADKILGKPANIAMQEKEKIIQRKTSTIPPDVHKWGRAGTQSPGLKSYEKYYPGIIKDGSTAIFFFQYMTEVNLLVNQEVIPGYLELDLPSKAALKKYIAACQMEAIGLHTLFEDKPKFDLVAYMWNKFGNPIWNVQYELARSAGMVTGAILSIKDFVMTIPDLISFIYYIITNFSKLFDIDLDDLWKVLVNDAKQFASEILNESPWVAGFAFGKVIGYIIMEVLFAIITAGTSTAVKVSVKSTTTVAANLGRTRELADTAKKLMQLEKRMKESPDLIRKIDKIQSLNQKHFFELKDLPQKMKKVRKRLDPQPFKRKMISIAKNKNHPCHYTVDLAKNRFKSGKVGEMDEISLVAGHGMTYKSGAQEMLLMEDADFNNYASVDEKVAVFSKWGWNIDGFLIEHWTAWNHVALWYHTSGKNGLNPDVFYRVMKNPDNVVRGWTPKGIL